MGGASPPQTTKAVKPPKLDQIELAISGEPKTTPEQDALTKKVKNWLRLKIMRLLK